MSDSASTGAKRFGGGEQLHESGALFADEHGPITLADWWSWANSDILDDPVRGSLAEYLVARLLLAEHTTRKGWPFDFEAWGARFEVKSSAYLQAWEKPNLTSPSFSVPKSKEMSRGKGFPGTAKRHADIYVFCLLAETNRLKVEALNLDQWQFYPMTLDTVERLASANSKISLGRLRTEVEPCTARALRRRVVGLLDDSGRDTRQRTAT